MFQGNSYDLQGKKIWIAGHKGLVGSAVVRALHDEPCEILTSNIDLRDQTGVRNWMAEQKPDAVILAAAKVGGIGANSAYPAEFLYDNMMIAGNVIHESYGAGVEKLLFLGSSCIYPRAAVQPIKEEALLSGPLEETNEAYAVAKIAGIKLCQAYRRQHGCDFIAAMPCNLYGPGDRFDEANSHVIPALMMKAHAAKISAAEEMVVWGTGTPLREFLHVDDLAAALVFLMKYYSGEDFINIGSGLEVSIQDLATIIAEVVGFEGRLVFDKDKPDGTPRKVLDSERIKTAGWAPVIDLRVGLEETYRWYQSAL